MSLFKLFKDVSKISVRHLHTKTTGSNGLRNNSAAFFLSGGKYNSTALTLTVRQANPQLSLEHNLLADLKLLSIQNIDSIKSPPGIKNPIKDPNEHKRQEVENPLIGILNDITIPTEIVQKNIDLPPTVANEPKLTRTGKYEYNMLIVRRKKMRKHKLKKLRKKMKFFLAKQNQKREWKKEKKFQEGLLGQIREAEKFSAEEYVADKLAKLKAGSTGRW